jgi:hypothetical protein
VVDKIGQGTVKWPSLELAFFVFRILLLTLLLFLSFDYSLHSTNAGSYYLKFFLVSGKFPTGDITYKSMFVQHNADKRTEVINNGARPTLKATVTGTK